MITSSNNETNGRLGNILFRTASLIGISNKCNNKLILPKSKYVEYFISDLFEGTIEELNCTFKYLSESDFHYTKELYDIESYENVNINGYLQSKKYWEQCEELVKNTFKFNDDFICSVIGKCKSNIFDKETIAIHIRRGDYIGNNNYVQLEISYYILALFENFTNWRSYNIIIFSDDISYCKVHFDCIPNVYFSENNSDIEDLCLMSQCNHFIISNSTFSWWGAYLGSKKNSKVIRPNYLFNGELLKKNNFKDFYLPEWINFDHNNENGEDKKIDLNDVSFQIPVRFDSQDRRENLDLCISIIKKYFDTEIIVYEQGDTLGDCHFKYLEKDVIFKYDTMGGIFHRTKMLNEMALMTNKKYIFNWDADVIVSPLQIFETVTQLRNGADMCYPYKWAFALLDRNIWYNKLLGTLDIGVVGNTVFPGMYSTSPISVGGAVGFNRESFIKGGMENENYISYSCEDVERKMRFEKLGYRVERTLGNNLYHVNHWIGINSSVQNPYFLSGNNEYDKEVRMNIEEFKEYIKSFRWGLK